MGGYSLFLFFASRQRISLRCANFQEWTCHCGCSHVWSFKNLRRVSSEERSSILSSMRQLVLAAVLVAVLAQLAAADTCGGNCPSDDCPSCPCGTGTNYVNIANWCAGYGWGQSCCQCIVSHESGGNGNAANYNDNGSFDIGLWQVNEMNWNDCSGGNAPCDISTNQQCAIDVYRWGGNTWRLWSTCGGCGCCNSG